MTPRPTLALAAATLALAIAPAAARPLEAELPPKRKACFERSYDAAHLAAHPRQKVTRVRLIHLPENWDAPERDRFYVMLKFNLRQRTTAQPFDYALGGFCRPSRGGLSCVNEWDAGTWRIEADGTGGLLVRNGGLIVNPDPYDAEEIADGAARIPPQPDDRAWRLAKAPDAGCVLD